MTAGKNLYVQELERQIAEGEAMVKLLAGRCDAAEARVAELDKSLRGDGGEFGPLRAQMAKGRARYPLGATVVSLEDEAGEVVHAINKGEPLDRVRDELLDVAGVAMRLYLGEIDTSNVLVGLAMVRRPPAGAPPRSPTADFDEYDAEKLDAVDSVSDVTAPSSSLAVESPACSQPSSSSSNGRTPPIPTPSPKTSSTTSKSPPGSATSEEGSSTQSESQKIASSATSADPSNRASHRSSEAKPDAWEALVRIRKVIDSGSLLGHRKAIAAIIGVLDSTDAGCVGVPRPNEAEPEVSFTAEGETVRVVDSADLKAIERMLGRARSQRPETAETRAEIVRDAAAYLRFCAGLAERNRHAVAVVSTYRDAAEHVEMLSKEPWRSPAFHGPLRGHPRPNGGSLLGGSASSLEEEARSIVQDIDEWLAVDGPVTRTHLASASARLKRALALRSETPAPSAVWTEDHHRAQSWLAANISRQHAMGEAVEALFALLQEVRREALSETEAAVREESRLCDGGCGTDSSMAAISEVRHGRHLCENCAWEHDHGEEDCGWECSEIPAAVLKKHRQGKCGTFCPNPKKAFASAPTGSVDQ